MKRIIFCLAMLCTCLLCQAQTEITTYSSCDTNTNGTVDVTDVTNTTNKVLKKAATETNVVTAEQLNTILNEINAKLDELKELKSWMQSIASTTGALTPDGMKAEAVDLGLSVKWATYNVGATKPEEYGLYFAWGETIGYGSDTSDGHSFDWANYKWCDGSKDALTKYNNVEARGSVDNITTLESSDDAAKVNWGGTWRMPTYDEYSELLGCTWEETNINGVYGYNVIGSNGNSIFLPAAGSRSGNGVSSVNEVGVYWTSSLFTSTTINAYFFAFSKDDGIWKHEDNYWDRVEGQSIRPVCQ